MKGAMTLLGKHSSTGIMGSELHLDEDEKKI
jgi:hypothetical protein